MKRQIGVLLFFFLSAGVVRLPMILADHFVLDGDEAIVALMSLEALRDGIWQPLFWGQNYGFVLPEVLTTVPFMAVFGASAFTAKLPMLLWFMLGAGAIYATIGHFTKMLTTRYMLTLLVFLAPTWLLWSMRLRGGYVPAFAIAHCAIYLSVATNSMGVARGALIGLLLGLTFVLQAIWFPGAACFAFVAWWMSGRSWKPLFVALFTMVLPYLLLMPFHIDRPFHQPPFFRLDGEVIAFNTSIYVSYLERGMQGLYLHGKAFRGLISANVFSIAFLFLTAGVLWTGLRRLIAQKKMSYLFAALASIISLLLWSFCLGSAAPRYALPLFGYVILTLAILWPQGNSGWLKGLVLGMLGLSISTLLHSDEIKYEDFTQQEMHDLVSTLEQRNIELVFTENALLQWQVLYYCDGNIVTRSLGDFDRRMERMPKAQLIYARALEKCALVDWSKDAAFSSDWSNAAFSVDFEPSRQFLAHRGFRAF